MGIGAPGAYWTIPLESQIKLSINGKVFKGIADSGTDVTILREEEFPPGGKLSRAKSHPLESC